METQSRRGCRIRDATIRFSLPWQRREAAPETARGTGRLSTSETGGKRRHRPSSRFLANTGVIVVAIVAFVEEPSKVRLDDKPRLQRIDRCVGLDIGRVDEAFVVPNESRRDALFDDRLEERSEERNPVPLPDTSNGRKGPR